MAAVRELQATDRRCTATETRRPQTPLHRVLTRHGAVHDVNPGKAGGVVGAGTDRVPAWREAGRWCLTICPEPMADPGHPGADAHPVSLGQVAWLPLRRSESRPGLSTSAPALTTLTKALSPIDRCAPAPIPELEGVAVICPVGQLRQLGLMCRRCRQWVQDRVWRSCSWAVRPSTGPGQAAR